MKYSPTNVARSLSGTQGMQSSRPIERRSQQSTRGLTALLSGLENRELARSLQPGVLPRPLTRKEVPAFPPSPEAYFHASLWHSPRFRTGVNGN